MKSKQPTAVICLSPNKGGMELAGLKLAKILSDYNDVTLIVRDNHFMHKQCLGNKDYSNLKFETIDFRSTFSFSIIYHARRIIKEKHIKNVIFLGASELKSLYFSFLGLDINLIVRHGTTKSNPKKDLFHKLIYSRVSAHVAISKHLAKNVAYIVPFGKNTKLTTIIPSMPKACSQLPKTKNETLQLLHVGRITPGKGLAEALLACEALYKNKINFHFNSYGSIAENYKEEFIKFIDSLPYKDSFEMCGFTDNIYDKYPKHDIFLFPTKGEGFGNVLMEAISHGIIVLAFDNTAVSNFKEMGFHIHLVEDKNVQALSEELYMIVQNLDKEIELAQENRENAKDLFAPSREANEYLELLV
ncbi:glycosyltransferase [Sulfurimonas sp. HSL-1716]|uniref:glycosyltransferase n=1 Tax=Hydrocurvibacter sulfurireducens TaxID=3131937 RepID=UPI0031F7F139